MTRRSRASIANAVAAQIGCVDDKKLLAEIMIEKLRDIRARRVEIDRDPSIVWNALREGTRLARERAGETLEMVRKAMKIDFPEMRGLPRVDGDW